MVRRGAHFRCAMRSIYLLLHKQHRIATLDVMDIFLFYQILFEENNRAQACHIYRQRVDVR